MLPPLTGLGEGGMHDLPKSLKIPALNIHCSLRVSLVPSGRIAKGFQTEVQTG